MVIRSVEPLFVIFKVDSGSGNKRTLDRSIAQMFATHGLFIQLKEMIKIWGKIGHFAGLLPRKTPPGKRKSHNKHNKSIALYRMKSYILL